MSIITSALGGVSNALKNAYDTSRQSTAKSGAQIKDWFSGIGGGIKLLPSLVRQHTTQPLASYASNRIGAIKDVLSRPGPEQAARAAEAKAEAAAAQKHLEDREDSVNQRSVYDALLAGLNPSGRIATVATGGKAAQPDDETDITKLLIPLVVLLLRKL